MMEAGEEIVGIYFWNHRTHKLVKCSCSELASEGQGVRKVQRTYWSCKRSDWILYYVLALHFISSSSPYLHVILPFCWHLISVPF